MSYLRRTMTDELEPALSAEEWAFYFGQDHQGNDRRHMLRNPRLESDFAIVGEIAMNNASLPDDSPYKITRRDVRALRDQIEWLHTHHFNGPTLIDGIAAKLDALLPSE